MEYDALFSIDSRRSGFEYMPSRLIARAIDYARFGRLYLHDGEWNGKKIISGNWTVESTTENRSIPREQYPEWFGNGCRREAPVADTGEASGEPWARLTPEAWQHDLASQLTERLGKGPAREANAASRFRKVRRVIADSQSFMYLLAAVRELESCLHSIGAITRYQPAAAGRRRRIPACEPLVCFTRARRSLQTGRGLIPD